MAKKAASRKKKTKKKTTRKPVASRSSAAKSRKKTSNKKATSKKKTASKKKTTRKTAKKKTTGKKVTRKSPSSKKAATRKTSKKKATSKKKVARKTTSKKKVTKAPAAAKTTKKKTSKAASRRKTTKKKVAGRKTSRRRGSRGFVAGDFNAGQAAAARLAASAGLLPNRNAEGKAVAASAEYKRLKKSPFTAKQLRDYRAMLVLKRAEIIGDVASMESSALRGGESGSLSHLPQHMADQGSDAYDQSLALDLAASQRSLLKEIDAAIARIDNKTYGICELHGKPINKERLKNTPWARFSIEAARELERNG